MASSYPGALDNFATDKANATTLENDHPGHHNDIADAVNKIEAELGVNPSGPFSTAVQRLAAGGRFPLDVPPSSASSWDDEFDGSSLDGKWTVLNSKTSSVSIEPSATVENGRVFVQPAASGTGVESTRGAFGYRQNAPTGSFTMTAKLVHRRGLSAGSDARWGIFLADVGTTTAYVFGQQSSQLRLANLIGCATYSTSAEWGTFNGTDSNTGAGSQYQWTWYKIVYSSGAGTFDAFYSTIGDSEGWLRLAAGVTLGQPDHIGIAGYANTAGFYADEGVLVDWFRVTEP